jgi:hypothetical protein
MSGGTISTGASGWVALINVGTTAAVAIYYKPNCGAGETAPTFSGTTATSAMLSEFSGASTEQPEASGSSTSTSSTANVAATVADLLGTDLILLASSYAYSMTATKTTSFTANNWTGAISGNQNNDASAVANHYRFAYAIATALPSPAAADQFTDTFTTTNMSARSGVIGSIRAPGVAPTYSILNMPHEGPA